MNAFDYHRPASTADAIAALGSSTDGRLIAGGQSLLPAMKLGLAAPTDLIDLAGIALLRGITHQSGSITIGAMSTHAEVARSDAVRSAIPALAGLADGIGDQQVRARGTIGGSLANNDPAACYPSAVLALKGVIKTNRRNIDADDFFIGIYQTALDPQEVIESVSFAQPVAAAYIKFRQPASHYALVGVFVARFADGVRVAVTGSAACAFRVHALEQALSANWSPEAARAIKVDASELNSDLHASAEYRAHLIPVLAARAVVAAH
jgi:carbon-monoxide dehydrogenase medium subunit